MQRGPITGENRAKNGLGFPRWATVGSQLNLSIDFNSSSLPTTSFGRSTRLPPTTREPDRRQSLGRGAETRGGRTTQTGRTFLGHPPDAADNPGSDVCQRIRGLQATNWNRCEAKGLSGLQHLRTIHTESLRSHAFGSKSASGGAEIPIFFSPAAVSDMRNLRF